MIDALLTRATIALAALVLATGTRLPAQLRIDVLDVGQGTAVLLRSQGHTALVDTGPEDSVADTLRARGIRALDVLLTSHNHADHLGGTDAVLDAFRVGLYVDNGHRSSTAAHARVERRLARVRRARPGPQRIALGSATLHVLPAPPLPLPADDHNNRSLFVVVEQGSFCAVLPGDAEFPLLQALLAARAVPSCPVLVASHHGSRNGVTPLWLQTIRPRDVLISAARGNPYGHPHPSALRYYQAGGRRVSRTDTAGTLSIEVEPDGSYRLLTGPTPR